MKKGRKRATDLNMKRKTKYQLAALLIFAAFVGDGLSQTPKSEPEKAQSKSKTPNSPANPLGGQEWRLKELDGEPIEQRHGAEPPDLKFDTEKKTVSGSTGINRLTGGYKLDANKLKFGNLAMTKMAGPEELMKQETEFVNALESVDSWKRTGDRLELMSGDKVVAAFAQPAQ
jgi:heat shock protein HslJ